MTREKSILVLDSLSTWLGYERSITEEIVEAIKTLSQSSLPTNLDEMAQKVEDYYDVGEERGYLCCHRGDIKDAFIAGAEWQKEQMMKDAVEADVNTYELTPGGSAYVEFVVDMPVARFKFNDKVRIIIVKEE